MKDTNPLKIAMLGHKRIPSREGGIEVVVEELSARMAERGHHVTCYNRRGHHVSGKEFDGERRSEYRGIRLKSAFTVNRKGLAAMTSSVFAALKTAFGDYDIVHFHAEGPCGMLWLPKLFGKRCVATIHGLDWKRSKWGGFAARYIRFGEKTAVRFADEIIVLSQSVQDYFQKEYGRETVWIPNGVSRPDRVEAELIEAQWGLKKDGYILFLGRLVPEKGIQYLIQAFRAVETDKRLVIAGGSSDTDAFAQELEREGGKDGRVIFTGFVQGRALDELYSNAYLYVLPSDLEGMPLSLLEAMSYGNCCLTSDIAECAGVTEGRSVLFRRGDVEDLREKLQLLCDRSELVERYRRDAADFICERYSWYDTVLRTLALYRG